MTSLLHPLRESFAVSLDSLVVVPDFILFRYDVNVSYQHLGPAKLDDVTLDEHVVIVLLTIIEACLDHGIGPLAHVIRLPFLLSIVFVVVILDVLRSQKLNLSLIFRLF